MKPVVSIHFGIGGVQTRVNHKGQLVPETPDHFVPGIALRAFRDSLPFNTSMRANVQGKIKMMDRSNIQEGQ